MINNNIMIIYMSKRKKRKILIFTKHLINDLAVELQLFTGTLGTEQEEHVRCTYRVQFTYHIGAIYHRQSTYLQN